MRGELGPTLDAYLAARDRDVDLDVLRDDATGAFDRAVLGQDDAGPVGLHIAEGEFAGHSRRSDLATSAARGGKTEASVVRHGRGGASWWRGATSGRGNAGTKALRRDCSSFCCAAIGGQTAFGAWEETILSSQEFPIYTRKKRFET